MTTKSPKHRLPRLIPLLALGALLVVAACELSPRRSGPAPTEPALADLVDQDGERTVVRPGGTEMVVIRDRRTRDSSAVSYPAGPEDTTVLRAHRIVMNPESFQGAPLFFVDGERVGSIEGIDPQRIIEIEVLKGTAAVERHGPEAKDGVVHIRTGELRPAATPAGLEAVRVLPRRLEGAAAPPLILVDGVRHAGRAEEIDPQRIAQVEVIKDPAAAVARFGADAKHGVVLITLKDGASLNPEPVAPSRAPGSGSRTENATQEATGQIAGMVTDAATGQPLAGVEISVPPLRRGAVTNPEGRFLLIRLPAGRHTLVLKRGSVETRRREVEVTANGTQTVRVAL